MAQTDTNLPKPIRKSFVVQSKDAGIRLDTFLTQHQTIQSRSAIQKAIKRGEVAINGKKISRGSCRVAAGNRVSFSHVDSRIASGELVEKKMELPIIYCDNDLVVVDKPTGLVVHPAKGNTDNTVLNGLAFKYGQIKKLGKDRRFGLVHRIDKDTSGILLVALSQRGLWHYTQQFEKRNVKKIYVAIVSGDISKKFNGEEIYRVANYVGRNPKNRKKMAVVESTKGRLATTLFALVNKKDSEYGLISVICARLVTGRTHQIRVHLSNLGFPIIGDVVYGGLKYKRMLLHAFELSIQMLDGSIKVFTTNLPAEFLEITGMDRSAFLSRLKQVNEKLLK